VAQETRTQSNESSASSQELGRLGISILVRLKINHSEKERQCGRTLSDMAAICAHPAKKARHVAGVDEASFEWIFLAV
jgi:hypothetical protein